MVAFLGLGLTNQMLIWQYFIFYILLRLLKSVSQLSLNDCAFLLRKKKNYVNWIWLGFLIASLPPGTNLHCPRHLANIHLVLHPETLNSVTVFGIILESKQAIWPPDLLS